MFNIQYCLSIRSKDAECNPRYYNAPQNSRLLNVGRTMSVRIVVSVTELTNMDAKDRYVVEGIGEFLL